MESPDPDQHSQAFARFSFTRVRLLSYFMMVYAIPPTMQTLVRARQEGGLIEKVAHGIEDGLRMWGKFTEDVGPDDFCGMCDEVFLCRQIESLNQFLTEMLFAVFLNRPEALRSSESVRVVDVLAWGDSTTIVRRLAERKIDSLSYRSFDDLMKYLKEDLGLRPSFDDSDLQVVREAIEVRNITVHNSRRINSLFLRRTGRTDLEESVSFPLTLDYVIAASRATHSIVSELDRQFIKHFGLPVFTGKALALISNQEAQQGAAPNPDPP
jgi:hypothetical protein